MQTRVRFFGHAAHDVHMKIVGAVQFDLSNRRRVMVTVGPRSESVMTQSASTFECSINLPTGGQRALAIAVIPPTAGHIFVSDSYKILDELVSGITAGYIWQGSSASDFLLQTEWAGNTSPDRGLWGIGFAFGADLRRHESLRSDTFERRLEGKLPERVPIMIDADDEAEHLALAQTLDERRVYRSGYSAGLRFAEATTPQDLAGATAWLESSTQLTVLNISAGAMAPASPSVYHDGFLAGVADGLHTRNVDDPM
jgi:hypothetical protein